MSDFIAAAAQVVGGAIIQDMVSRSISFALGKRKEKTSQGQYMERLGKAVHEVEFVLERTAKLPITEVSLLRYRFELKCDFIQTAACLLNSRHKKRQGHKDGPVSSFIATSRDELCLSWDDVKRFERLADSARSILTRVESGCSLRRLMHFSSPLVRHLLEWKTLRYRTVQAHQERHLEVWPAGSQEDRGVEAVVRYWYSDHTMPDKSFFLALVIRLSESTDIVGIAIKCLRSLASQFNLVADTPTGELTLLANLQDVSHSHTSLRVGIEEEHREVTQTYRPDPLCCKAKDHTPCANKAVVLSEVSQAFPEEVILFYFVCYISAPECILHNSVGAQGKTSIMKNGRRQPLQLTVVVMPHYAQDDQRQQESYAFEQIGNNCEELVDVSIQQMGETVRPRAINCFLHQPKVTEYTIGWVAKHGAACFMVERKSEGALKNSGRVKEVSRRRSV